MLGALLLDVNRSLGADVLVDRVWADRPPHRARNVLSAYVSRLRRLVGAVPGARISRGPAGYVLAADAASVDLHRFRALVGRARAAEDPGEAVALYADALGLWHGEPFAGIDGPWFDEVRTSLHGERAAAVLDRNDAGLRAGRHSDLLVELTAGVRADPLDERACAQLMLAQYRSGRLADALGSYQRIHLHLRDELGAEPGPALRRVHQEILTGDAAALPPTVVVRRPDPPRAPDPAPPSPTLPRRVTTFVGRATDVDRVASAVRDGPLVTLTGVGGVGKTRLALEVADGATARFADGGWLCELAPVADPDAVGHVLAAALRVQQRAGRTIGQTVVEYLADRELLLVLDNCEHVLDAVAELVGSVLRHCPQVVVLATSREPLGVDGERILPVEPLAPADAATLFTDRARGHRPDLSADDRADGAVAEICRRLDGLPLGIELAASRMRVMTAVEVADRLAVGMRVVSGRARGVPARHQSLVAAVDWSYRLLSAGEQALFAQLSVFAGAFDLDAAHGVCGTGGTVDDTLDLLIGLVDKSMVAVDLVPGTTRYRMLETMRRYARERLAGALDATLDRHARYLADLVGRAAAALRGPEEAHWVGRLTLAYDDLRVAVRRAIDAEDTEVALRLTAGLPDFAYWRVGYELADWSEAALALPGAGTHLLGPGAHGSAARGAWCLGDFPRAVRIAGACGEPEWVESSSRCGQPADVLAHIALYTGRIADATTHYRRQVELAREAGDPVRLNWTLFQLATCRAAARDMAGGRRDAEEALVVATASGNPSALSLGLFAVGYAVKWTEPERALVFLDDSAAAAESVQNRWFAGLARMEAAATRAVHADPGAAAHAFVDVLDRWDRLGDRNQVWQCLHYVVRLLVRMGAVAEPVVLHHAVVAAGRAGPLDPARLARLAAALGDEPSEAAARRGSALDAAGALALARSALRHPS